MSLFTDSHSENCFDSQEEEMHAYADETMVFRSSEDIDEAGATPLPPLENLEDVNDAGDEPALQIDDDEPALQVESVSEDVDSPVSEVPHENTTESSTALPTMSEILDAIEGVNAKLANLESQFTARIAKTDAESKVIDQMHAELQEYKNDLQAQLIMPALRGLATLREDFAKVISMYEEKPEEEQSVPLRKFADFIYDIEEILYDAEMEIQDATEGDPVDPLKHKIFETIPTGIQNRHSTIARTVGNGYVYKGKVIMQQRVAAYRYDENLSAEIENAQLEGSDIDEKGENDG